VKESPTSHNIGWTMSERVRRVLTLEMWGTPVFEGLSGEELSDQILVTTILGGGVKENLILPRSARHGKKQQQKCFIKWIAGRWRRNRGVDKKDYTEERNANRPDCELLRRDHKDWGRRVQSQQVPEGGRGLSP